MDLLPGHTVFTISSADMMPSPAIIFHARSRSCGPGIFPRNHEDRMAFPYKIFHKRVLRRQVQDVILSDPGGHDENRLRMDLRRWPAGTGSARSAHCGRMTFPGVKPPPPGPPGRCRHHPAACGPQNRTPAILNPVAGAANQVIAASLLSGVQHLRVGPRINFVGANTSRS